MGVELPQWLRDFSAEGWGAVAAFAALALTVWNVVARGVRQRREAKTATLTITLEYFQPRPDSTFPRHFFKVANVGRCEAREVNLMILSTDPAEAAEWGAHLLEEGLWPLPRVRSGQTVQVPTQLTLGMPFHFDVTLGWLDGRNGPQVTTATIYLPQSP